MDTRVQKGNTSDDSGVVDAGCEGDEDDDGGGGGAAAYGDDKEDEYGSCTLN